jgi:hypothetical protein
MLENAECKIKFSSPRSLTPTSGKSRQSQQTPDQSGGYACLSTLAPEPATASFRFSQFFILRQNIQSDSLGWQTHSIDSLIVSMIGSQEQTISSSGLSGAKMKKRYPIFAHTNLHDTCPNTLQTRAKLPVFAFPDLFRYAEYPQYPQY